MSQTFASLSKEFNDTAAKFAGGEGVWQMTVNKYSLLMRHKAETPEQKEALTARLLDAAIKRLEKTVDDIPGMNTFSASRLESLYGVFKALCTDENMPFMPRDASARMADASLRTVRVMENYEKHDRVTYEEFNKLRTNYIEFAGFMVDAAQVVKTAEDTARPQTQNDVTVGKPANIKSRVPQKPN